MSPPQGHLAVSGDIFRGHSWDRVASGNSWIEARDAAEHPAKHRATPPVQERSGAKVTTSEGEKLWLPEKSTPLLFLSLGRMVQAQLKNHSPTSQQETWVQVNTWPLVADEPQGDIPEGFWEREASSLLGERFGKQLLMAHLPAKVE